MANGVVVVVSGKDDTGAVFAAIQKHMAQTKTAANETSASLGSIGKTLTQGLAAAGITIGLQQIISTLKNAVTSAAEFGEQLTKASQRTGIAVGTLSVLHYAADVTNTDFDRMNLGVSRMGKNLADAADGNKKLSAAFQSIGINAKDVVGRTDALDIVFHKLSAAMNATDAPARRLQIAMALMGRGGSDSIPVIMDLAQHFDELKQKAQDAGVYIDELHAKHLAELNAKLKDVTEHIQGAEVALTDGLTPSLTQMFGVMSGGMPAMNGFNEAGQHIGKTFAFMASSIYGAMASYEAMKYVVNKGLGETEFGAARKRDLATGDQNKADSDLYQAKANALADIAYGRTPAPGANVPIAPPSGSGIKPPPGGGGGKGGRTAKAAAEPGIPIDAGVAAEMRARQHSALEELHALEHPEAAPGGIIDPQMGAKMAAQEKLRQQTEALQALDLKGDAIESNAGIVTDNIQQRELAGTLSQRDAAKQLQDARAEELKELQALAAQYASYGAAGRDAYAGIETEITRTMEAMQKQSKEVSQAAQGIAHAVFDPLFSMSEKWDNVWKSIGKNLEREAGRLAEQGVMGQLFGDGSKSGGGKGSRTGVMGVGGLLGDALGFFKKKPAAPTSNGGVGAGAGTVATAAASLMQTGKGAPGGAGIQVILNNQGAPMTVGSTSLSGGGSLEDSVINIMLKQCDTGGSVAQAFKGLIP